jgi:Na+-transporting methylmalonyl-CoA/oxaloacetate decarboxylase gamma subunit
MIEATGNALVHISKNGDVTLTGTGFFLLILFFVLMTMTAVGTLVRPAEGS